MLLPSDVARLVLGYLQEEGLSATSQTFIHESPNLKEYAEHTPEDGTIPACVFSLFGKDLTTILNEYVATKTKETCQEVPVIMTSLWKKLDFTLNQIKSLQNSPAISAHQRTRSRVGVANMKRQHVLSLAPVGSIICSSSPDMGSILSPVYMSHSLLSHSTPASYPATHTRPAAASSTLLQEGGRLLNTCRDSPVQIVVSEHRLNTDPMSPGRRKWETPRKRNSALSGSNGTSRSTIAGSNLAVEPQPEEDVDENFPQLVIQNARDKILGDRLLQEKLAENINKILANEPAPQTSKASSSVVEQDQSIDEILGLQGEIHMSDDAIHDILEQTESDPAFQALFDLFDYHKPRLTEAESGDGDVSSSPEESNIAGPSSTDRPPQSEDPGTVPVTDANVSDSTMVTGKMRAGQERKTRKPAASTSLKKTIIGPSRKVSRIENSSAKLLVSREEYRCAHRKEKGSDFCGRAVVETMDIDEPLNTPPPPPPPTCDSIINQKELEPAAKDNTPTSTARNESTAFPSSSTTAAYAAPETMLASNVDKTQDAKQANRAEAQTPLAPAPSDKPSPLLAKSNKSLKQTADLPHMTLSALDIGEDPQPSATLSVTPPESESTFTSATVTASPSSGSTAAPLAATHSSPTSASAPLTAALQNSPSTCTPAPAAPDPPTTPTKGATDSNNIVSLKIIISDNQDEGSSVDPALNQASSSISKDKIPTIYLLSPTQSTGSPGKPKAALDETAQAVSSLQNSEVLQPVAELNPPCSKTGAVASTLAGTSQVQSSYIIQLPLDPANPAVQGAAASYFLLTEPPTADAQARQVLVPAGVSNGQPLATSQYGMATPPRAQGFSTGSPLILKSPVQPVVLPASVRGQNTLGKVQMVSNQFVAIPPPPNPVQQSKPVKPQPPTVAVQQSTTPGITGSTTENVVSKVVQSLSPENSGQQNITKESSPSHRRILCFESSGEGQPHTAQTKRTTATPPAANMTTPHSAQMTEKDNPKLAQRTKSAIPGGNKPKRRVETVRCSEDTQAGLRLAKEMEKSMPPQQHEKDPVKRNPRKQDHNQESQNSSASRIQASQSESKKRESGRRSNSVDRKHGANKDGDESKANESHSSRSLSSDHVMKSRSRKEKEEGSRKEPVNKAPAKSHEGRLEKRTPSQELPNVTANKENEIKGTIQEQQQQSTPSSSEQRDLSHPVVPVPTPNPQSKSPKPPSKTTSLAKQAAEMLQDIQGLNSSSTPVKKPGLGSSDLPLPRTPGPGPNQQESIVFHRTPSRERNGKDGEGTPKQLIPPSTPDLHICSPSSEAGSENSINMAAHTLMILSRAAISRTGTPLKDSLRQEGAGEKSVTASKSSKKRKQSSPTASPPAKKESKQSPSSKRKDRDRKKLIDYFPHDLDVDKFLSSLHYDE
ncbi:hypothetical protein LDENG_00217920 [Lucifuga dentata]|nr:hypothetical protein LDENG_00217920 [Lucifuga dentata]